MAKKCKYCGKSPATLAGGAKKTYVCIDCLFESEQFDKDFKRSLSKTAAFEYPYKLNAGGDKIDST